jgi:hypothetical protein
MMGKKKKKKKKNRKQKISVFKLSIGQIHLPRNAKEASDQDEVDLEAVEPPCRA